MNRVIPTLILCLASVAVVAQNPTAPEDKVKLGNSFLSQQDYSSAMTWFRKAADQGSATARNNIGWLYQNGWGVARDYAEAAIWYSKAADQGNITAQVNLGWLYRQGLGLTRDYSQAMAWFRKASDQGNSQARVNVGWLYQYGLGVTQDYVEAATWYRLAAAQGNTDAQTYLGEFYQNGSGVQQDYAEAMNWYLQAAGKGNPEAELGVGWLYFKGLGVKQDSAEAMAWYYRAAEHGSTQAQNNIGWLYENGLGVTPDDAKAVSWYGKAAAQGNAQAKANLIRLSSGGPGDKPPTETTAPAPALTPTADKGSAPPVMMANGVHAPQVIYAPDPEYSAEARQQQTTGDVMLLLVVDPDGLTRDIKVIASLGDGLDEKAIDAVKKWKFEPATKDGKPVAVQIMIEVDFRLYQTGVGKVDIVGDPQGLDARTYLSPVIRDTSACWCKAAQDVKHPPSIKQGQLTVQFPIRRNLRLGPTEIVTSSGDDILDREARSCWSSLKASSPLPRDFHGNELVVQMQLLYNAGGASLAPSHAQLVVGGRKRFNIQVAGLASQAGDWSVTGVGCTDPACGTISADGLYTAPDALPDPPFVRVKATLAGANPMAGYATVTLVK